MNYLKKACFISNSDIIFLYAVDFETMSSKVFLLVREPDAITKRVIAGS